MIRWGFLGAGSIARSSLAPAVHAAQDATLYSVAARDAGRAERLEPTVAYDDYRKLLADPNVDVVYVCLHNSGHLPWVCRALAAGKHVVCEKPLGLSATEVDEMIGLAQVHRRLLMEACWNRWHPRTRELTDLLRDELVGDVRHVTAVFQGARPTGGNYRLHPGLGGGALLDVGCYAVSAVLDAFGWDVPIEVDASALSWDRGSADRMTAAVLDFVHGHGNVTAMLGGSPLEILDIRGTAGRVWLEDPAFTAGTGAVGLHAITVNGPVLRNYPPIDPYREMVAQFSAAVRGEPAYLVPLPQSLAVAKVLDRIRASAEAAGVAIDPASADTGYTGGGDEPGD